MRIAMFVDCYHPIINGVTTSVQLLALALRDRGHQVLLFAPEVAGYADTEPWVRRFASLTFPLHQEERFSLPWPTAHLSEALRFDPDVVHLHTPFNVGMMGWWVAARLGRPRVFTHHTLFDEYLHYLPLPQALTRPAAVGLCRWFWNTSALVLAPSEEVRLRVQEQGLARPLRVLPTGVDGASFQGGDGPRVREELGLGPGERVLLYMGRLAREKSLDFLLEVLRRALRDEPRLRLLLLGDGPERPALEARAAGLGLGDRVLFLGYRPRAELRDYLAAARVFVFTSQTETQGLVLLEAQSAGLPVVAVRASGSSEAVSPGEGGLLIPPGDLEAFAGAVVRLVGDEAFRSRLARGARAWAEQFSTGAMGARALEAYSEAVRAGG